MPPNRSSWYSLIWWSRFTTGWIHSSDNISEPCPFVHSVHNVLCSTSQDFIHKRRGNSFSFQNRMSGQKSFYSHKQWYPGPVSATGRWEEGAHSLEAVWCVPHLSLCLYLHWYLISLSFRCLPQQPALCVASGAQATSQGVQKYKDLLFTLVKFTLIFCLFKLLAFSKSFLLKPWNCKRRVKPFNIFLPPEQFVTQARLLRICISVIKI